MAKLKIDGTIGSERWTSVSSGQAITEDLSFNWKIENFLAVKSSTELINEQKFHFTGESSEFPTKWFCTLENYSTNNEIGIYLCLESAPLKFRPVVSFTFQMTKSNGEIGKKLSGTQIDRKLFGADVRDFGFPAFIPEEDGALQDLISEDGSLTIKVNVKVVLFKPAALSKQVDDEVREFELSELRKLSQSMIQMLDADNRLEAGKVIKVVSRDDKEFLAKSDILSARSPVFQAMFNSGKWKEGNGSLVLKDLSGKTVKVLLHYLYGGVLLPEDWKADDVILELTWASQKYQLDGLSEFLDKILPLMDFGSAELLAKLALLAKRQKMNNAERGLFAKLKESATDIEQLILDKEGSLLGLD